MPNGNGIAKTIGIVAVIVAILAAVFGWGLGYGVTKGEIERNREYAQEAKGMAKEACIQAGENEKVIIGIQKDVQRLPDIENKLDELLTRTR